MEAKLLKSRKSIAIIYPWLNLYGGGEVFLEYCNNLLSSKNKIDLYFYDNKKKIHKKLNLNKQTKLLKIRSENTLVNFLCSRFMIFAQAYIIYYFQKYNKKNYNIVYSASGEFFSKFKTIQYIHICIFSLNIFEYKNFGLSNPLKMLLRLIAALVCRFLIGINKKSFKNVYTLTNSKWSLERLSKTYLINNKKVLYPTFKIPKFEKNNLKTYKKRANNFVILGRVSEDKRIIQAINFFNKIKKKISNSKLEIIGPIDKIYLKKIKIKITDLKQVHFHGLVTLKKRDEILKKSKYGLNFFHSEHFGRSTLEMQKLGMIVFAKNAGGVREILLSKFQKYDDYNDLEEKILKIHFSDKIKKNVLLKNKKKFKLNLTDRQFCKSFISNFN